MLVLPPETERLAKRLAAAQGVAVGEAVKRAIETSARAAGVGVEPGRQRRRLSADQMLAIGSEIAAMPVLDPRSPREIMDDLNAV